MVTFDAMDAPVLAAWWADALGGEVVSDPGAAVVAVQLPQGLQLGFRTVAEPTPGKNRVHLDLADVAADDQLKRLQDLGAAVLRRHEMESYSWVVLADPEGNQFCLATAPM
jgi:predicted enzyme related to lactoylglutathione lyase